MEYSLAGRISVNTEQDTCMAEMGQTQQQRANDRLSITHIPLSWHQAQVHLIGSLTSQTPIEPSTISDTSPSISEEWMQTVLLFSWQETESLCVFFCFFLHSIQTNSTSTIHTLYIYSTPK